jgi:serine/threonine-protein kinase
MAPEQAMGGKADARVDVYAVGLVMYELLAGVQPFIADNFGKLVIEITQSPVPPLPPKTPGGEPIPPGLAQVVLRCLEKDPDARFPSAAALADALEPFMGKGPVRAAASKPVEIDEAELAAAVRPSRAPLIAAIVVVLLLAAAVAWTFISPPGESGETAKGPKVTEPAPAAIPAPAPSPTPADPTPPTKTETAPVPVPPKSVWLDVKTKPVGAQVRRGEEILGVTPLRLEVAPAEKASLSIALANYVDETREVALTEDVALSVELKPAPKTKTKKKKKR